MQIEVGFLWNVMTTARPQSGQLLRTRGSAYFSFLGAARHLFATRRDQGAGSERVLSVYGRAVSASH